METENVCSNKKVIKKWTKYDLDSQRVYYVQLFIYKVIMELKNGYIIIGAHILMKHCLKLEYLQYRHLLQPIFKTNIVKIENQITISVRFSINNRKSVVSLF